MTQQQQLRLNVELIDDEEENAIFIKVSNFPDDDSREEYLDYLENNLGLILFQSTNIQ